MMKKNTGVGGFLSRLLNRKSEMNFGCEDDTYLTRSDEDTSPSPNNSTSRAQLLNRKSQMIFN